MKSCWWETPSRCLHQRTKCMTRNLSRNDKHVHPHTIYWATCHCCCHKHAGSEWHTGHPKQELRAELDGLKKEFLSQTDFLDPGTSAPGGPWSTSLLNCTSPFSHRWTQLITCLPIGLMCPTTGNLQRRPRFPAGLEQDQTLMWAYPHWCSPKAPVPEGDWLEPRQLQGHRENHLQKYQEVLLIEQGHKLGEQHSTRGQERV